MAKHEGKPQPIKPFEPKPPKKEDGDGSGTGKGKGGRSK